MITKDTKIIVGPEGSSISLICDTTGEVYGTIPLHGGVHYGRDFLQYCSMGVTLQPKADIQLFTLPSRVGTIFHPDAHFDTDANPEWQPSEALRQAQFFEQVLSTVRAETSKQTKRLLTAKRVVKTDAPSPETQVETALPLPPVEQIIPVIETEEPSVIDEKQPR